jgi:hypothetical protein
MSFLELEDRGAKFIDRLSSDLVIEFPDMKGFPVRKLKNIRKFAAAWHDSPFVQHVAAQIPLSRHCVIPDNEPDLCSVSDLKVRHQWLPDNPGEVKERLLKRQKKIKKH